MMFGLIKSGFQTTANTYASLFGGIKSFGLAGGIKSFLTITTAPMKLVTGLFTVGGISGGIMGGFFLVRFFKLLLKLLLVLLIVFILLKIFKRFRNRKLKKEIKELREKENLRELNHFKRRKEE